MIMTEQFIGHHGVQESLQGLQTVFRHASAVDASLHFICCFFQVRVSVTFADELRLVVAMSE